MSVVVAVGSVNPVKVGAVQEVLQSMRGFEEAVLMPAAVASGVSDQPLSLEETFRGAEGRARAAVAHAGAARLGIGMEDGMYPCPTDPARYLNVCVACAVEGERVHFGCSSAFMYPDAVVRLVLEQGMDVSQALRAAGLTAHPRVGADVGAIGLLSGGRLVRKDYTKQALVAALLPWG
jgi:inosine/xanthosine triphosphatase